MADEYKKILPDLKNETSAPYWASVKEHQMRLQKCDDCGHVRFPYNTICTDCLSPNAQWLPVTGNGTLYSWVQFYQRYHAGWEDELPYNVAYVLLDEGVGLITNLVNVKPEDITIGMPVKIYYDDVTPEVTLPKFQPA